MEWTDGMDDHFWSQISQFSAELLLLGGSRLAPSNPSLDDCYRSKEIYTQDLDNNLLTIAVEQKHKFPPN